MTVLFTLTMHTLEPRVTSAVPYLFLSLYRFRGRVRANLRTVSSTLYIELSYPGQIKLSTSFRLSIIKSYKHFNLTPQLFAAVENK